MSDQIVGTTVWRCPDLWNYSGAHRTSFPCGCNRYYFLHNLGVIGARMATLYDSLCECTDCGSVWWDSDWMGEL
jgi:hypothetical protein